MTMSAVERRGYVLLRAGGRRFAFPADAVQEVLAAMELVAGVASPWFVDGLIELDGTVLAVTSLAALLNLPRDPDPVTGHWLLLRSVAASRLLAVERVEGVEHFDASAWQAVDPVDSFNGVVAAQIPSAAGPRLRLDLDRLLLERERAALAEFTQREAIRLAALPPVASTPAAPSPDPGVA
jgi:chemotaxis signal transduction protein